MVTLSSGFVQMRYSQYIHMSKCTICFYLYFFSAETLNNNDYHYNFSHQGVYNFLYTFLSSRWFTTYPKSSYAKLTCPQHLPRWPFYFFMYSLGLPYLWPQFLFDKWGYDNPIYSPKSQCVHSNCTQAWTNNPTCLWMTSHVTTWFRIPDFKLLCSFYFDIL